MLCTLKRMRLKPLTFKRNERERRRLVGIIYSIRSITLGGRKPFKIETAFKLRRYLLHQKKSSGLIGLLNRVHIIET